MKTRHAPGPDGQPQKAKRVIRKVRKAAETKVVSPAPEQDLLAAVMDQSLQSSVPVVPPGTTVEVPVSTQPTDTQYNSATIVVNIVHDSQPVRADAIATNTPPTPVAMMTHHHQPVTVLPAPPQVTEPTPEPPIVPIAPVPLAPLQTGIQTEATRPYIQESMGMLPQATNNHMASQLHTGPHYVPPERQVLQTLMPVSFMTDKTSTSVVSSRPGELNTSVAPTLLPATGAFQPVTSDRAALGPPPLNPTPIMSTPLTPSPMTPSPLAPSPMVTGVGSERATPTNLTGGHELPPPMVVLTSVPISHTNTVQYVPATFSTYVNYDGRY